MALAIEDYALIGDTLTAALVGRDGSIDWLCLPRFDSPACFAALLGDPSHGRWLLSPAGGGRPARRRYRPGTLVLETEHETPGGVARVVDFMPPRGREPDLVRIVEGVRGRVEMKMELVIRFDYGRIVPWIRRVEPGVLAVAGPDAVVLESDVETHGEDLTTVAEFTISQGEQAAFVLMWNESYEPLPQTVDVRGALAETEEFWSKWSSACAPAGAWSELVTRSLITLKALTFAPSGGIVAAATTSLPEQLGGVRNWDYRFCWLRDATLTLYSLLSAGYTQEAVAWRDWLLRAAAGQRSKLQIMYGPAGEHRLPELVLDWLPGYQGAAPVRVGNAASEQFQLDVYGEVMDTLHHARELGIQPDEYAWALQHSMMEFLESAWREPDEGIWEVRGGQRHFTHSKVMAWVAFDRAVKAVEHSGLEGPVERWRALREEVHREVCERGFDPDRGAFVQFYGADQLDASLLMLPLVGFLPAGDPRVRGTVEAIERDLCHDGFVLRYPTGGPDPVDGLPPGEGAFLPCTFWLVDNLVLQGRRREAEELYERLVGVCNDVGLLAEEYDPRHRRLVGNFPQAFSHVGLINSAFKLRRRAGPAEERGQA